MSSEKFLPDKHGQLGIWDARAPQEDADDEDKSTEEDGKYWRLQVHWPATSKSVSESFLILDLD